MIFSKGALLITTTSYTVHVDEGMKYAWLPKSSAVLILSDSISTMHDKSPYRPRCYKCLTSSIGIVFLTAEQLLGCFKLS